MNVLRAILAKAALLYVAAWPTSRPRRSATPGRSTSTIKTYFRRLEAAVAAGDDATADTELRELTRTIDKAVKRGAMHRNTGARKKSRAHRVRKGAGAAS
jgi:small subunit ribosomal protein S20